MRGWVEWQRDACVDPRTVVGSRRVLERCLESCSGCVFVFVCSSQAAVHREAVALGRRRVAAEMSSSIDGKDPTKVFLGNLVVGVSTRVLWEWLSYTLEILGVQDVFVNRSRDRFAVQQSAFITFDTPWRADTAIGMLEGLHSETFASQHGGYVLQAHRAQSKDPARDAMHKALAKQAQASARPPPPLPVQAPTAAAPDVSAIAISVATAVACVESTMRRLQTEQQQQQQQQQQPQHQQLLPPPHQQPLPST